MKNSLKVTFAYLAAVIGAGFASGSEAIYYFIRFGHISLLGVILTSVGFGLFAYTLLSLCKKHESFSFYELSQRLFGNRGASILNVALVGFMLIMLAAMISAFGEMMYSLTDMPRGIYAGVFCVLCFLVLLLPVDKIIKWGGIAGLFIVGFICICCVYMINFRCTNVFYSFGSMTASAAVYTAYNSFAVCPLLCEAAKELKTLRECKIVGWTSGVLSFFALFLIWCLISVYYGKINLGGVPMLTLAQRQGTVFAGLYTLVIFAAVLSSAVSNGYGIYLRIENEGQKKKTKLAFIMLSGWVLSSLGFSVIVSELYRYVGYVAIVIPICLMFKFKINGEKQR